MIKKKYFLILLCLFLYACESDVEDVEENEDIEEEIVLKEEIKTDKIIVTNDKDYFYRVLLSAINESILLRYPNDEIHATTNILHSKFEYSINYYLIDININELKKMNMDDFNDEEKKTYESLLNYLELKQSFIKYINPFVNEENKVILPENEINNYTDKLNEMNKILIDNKFLYEDMIDYYFNTERDYDEDMITFNDAMVKMQNQISNYTKSEPNVINSDLLEINYLYAFNMYNYKIIMHVANKDTDSVLKEINQFNELVKKEKETDLFKYNNNYKQYVNQVEQMMNDSLFLEHLKNNNHLEAFKRFSELNVNILKKYNEKADEIIVDYSYIPNVVLRELTQMVKKNKEIELIDVE